MPKTWSLRTENRRIGEQDIKIQNIHYIHPIPPVEGQDLEPIISGSENITVLEFTRSQNIIFVYQTELVENQS